MLFMQMKMPFGVMHNKRKYHQLKREYRILAGVLAGVFELNELFRGR